MDLQKLIAETVAIEVRKAIAATIGATVAAVNTTPAPVVVADRSPRGDKGHRRGSRVVYVAVAKRGGKLAGDAINFGGKATWEATWKAVRRAGTKGISAVDVERVTGLGKKTVESALWQLRRGDECGGVVKSVSAE